ncbi:MAG: hypothetical protein MI754_02185 [Chromatiales bacterium]|nr:hypothetical protein [Chromatiales bacterium]
MDELKQLKSLLLGEEQKTLDDIQERLSNARARAEEVAEALPYAVRKRSEQDNQLAQSLQQPVEDCLHAAIRKDTSTFADVLFPVMGPAIRRSITETLRGMLQSINKTLDESFSLRGLSWRFESMRTGVPFYDVVLRNTLIYRVEQTFLIQPETGLLMHHMIAPDVPAQDPDAVSAMLTAIEDFASDSFSQDQQGDALQTVNMGEHTLWLFHGPHGLLACVIRGVPPIVLRERFTEALELIHQLYSEELIAFDGNRTPLNPVEDILAECFISEQKEKERRSTSPLLILLVLGLISLLGWWGYQSYLARVQLTALIAALNATPGVVVLESRREGNQVSITGLKDPYTTLPQQTIEQIGYPPDALNYTWRQYHSDDPELAMARAQKLLSPPETITLKLESGTLLASGTADDDWISEARILTRTIAGIDSFDSSRVRHPDAVLLEQISAALQPPEGISLSLRNGELSVSGEAPNQWLISLRTALVQFEQLQNIDTHQAEPTELGLIRTTTTELEQIKIYFERGGNLLDGKTATLTRVKELILALLPLYNALDEKFVVEITGFTDGTGNFLLNQELARERASTVRQWLIDDGIKAGLLTIHGDISSAWGQTESDSLDEMRRAEFRVKSNLAQAVKESR